MVRQVQALNLSNDQIQTERRRRRRLISRQVDGLDFQELRTSMSEDDAMEVEVPERRRRR